MINLIPPTAKKGIITEYWIRVVTTWLFLLSILGVVCILILLPTYVLISSQVAVYRDSASKATEKIAVYENVASDLVEASQLARVALDTSRKQLLSEYVYLFESLGGNGVSLSEITISRGVGAINFSPVSLVGTASDRQTLADFRDRLLSQEEITSVDFPISNLAKDRDIGFSITVELSNEPRL